MLGHTYRSISVAQQFKNTPLSVLLMQSSPFSFSLSPKNMESSQTCAHEEILKTNNTPIVLF